MITVMVADDHVSIRKAVRRLLESDPAIKVVGECADGMQALETVKAIGPDVAVLDFAMPRLNGVEVARRIRQHGLPTRAIIITGHDVLPIAVAAAGVAPVLGKDLLASHLLPLIHERAGACDYPGSPSAT